MIHLPLKNSLINLIWANSWPMHVNETQLARQRAV